MGYSSRVLLVEEAGGRVTDFSGAPFQLNSNETLASNGLIHDELVACSAICLPGAN
jgi:myo-inositol-1(or 4)-monophosphatase